MILLGSQKIQRASLTSVELLQYVESCSYLNETAVSRMYLPACILESVFLQRPSKAVEGGVQIGHKYHNKESA